MNTVKTWQTRSSGPEDTFAIGERLGKACKGGEVFLLSSDLGGGKTTLTKGIGKGMGSHAVVSSPTFTVSREYTCPSGLTLHHFDFYRLNEGGMVAHELSEVLGDETAVIVIEWGDVVEAVIPDGAIRIDISRSNDGEEVRVLDCAYPEEKSYIMSTKENL